MPTFWFYHGYNRCYLVRGSVEQGICPIIATLLLIKYIYRLWALILVLLNIDDVVIIIDKNVENFNPHKMLSCLWRSVEYPVRKLYIIQ